MAQTVHTDGWTRWPVAEYVPKEHQLTGLAVENLVLKKIPFTEYLILMAYIGVTETSQVTQTFWQGMLHAIGDHGIIKAVALMADVVSDVGGVINSVHNVSLQDQNGMRYAQMFLGGYVESTATFSKILEMNLFFPNLDIPFDDDMQLRLAGDYNNFTGVTFDMGVNAMVYIQKQD